MNLKFRFSLTFSLLFSLILASLLLAVFSLFSNFRKDEIQTQLREKAQTTVQLLTKVKAEDYTLLQLIDSNTINNLYNEKTLIFDDNYSLVYKSIDDAVINWDTSLLQKIRHTGYVYLTEREYDIVGAKVVQGNKDYLVLVSAEDRAGKRNLTYLKYLFIAAFILGLVMVWSLSFYTSKRALLPLDEFKSKVQNISENNLSTRLDYPDRRDEISEMTIAFNTMIERIDKSFQYQKSFVGNASHELRTPLTKISAQLENLSQTPDFPGKFNEVIESIKEDTQQLSDIVTSLLVLAKLENNNAERPLTEVRIDEIIFSSAEFFRKVYPDFKMHFEIMNETDNDDRLEIKGDEALLKIAVSNLLKNAYVYSDNKEADIKIIQKKEHIQLTIANTGNTPDASDTDKLFGSFIRGSNAISGKGFGLGLSIVKRIVQYHNAEIRYLIPAAQLTRMELTFKV